MAGTAAVIGAVVTVVTAGGQLYQAWQASEDAEEQERQLRRERQRAAEIHDRDLRRFIGSQRAAYAASGVVVDEGTPLAVVRETERLGEEERRAILEGYDARISSLRTERRRLMVGGMMGAGGTLLGGVGAFASTYPFKTTTPTPMTSSLRRGQMKPPLT